MNIVFAFLLTSRKLCTLRVCKELIDTNLNNETNDTIRYDHLFNLKFILSLTASLQVIHGPSIFQKLKVRKCTIIDRIKL